MLYLNMRHLHFLQLTSLLNNLNIKLKIIVISEDWIKPYHIKYSIPNSNMQHNFRLHKEGGGVCLYIHNVLQYKLRNDLKLGSDPEFVNSVFVENQQYAQ